MRPTLPRASRARRDARGYTAVEVLIAMTMFAIGAAGVIGMQRVAIQGSLDARRFDLANSIAHEWVHRLERDTMRWTVLGSPPAPPITAQWINPTALTSCSAATWCKPTIPASPTHIGSSPAFDTLGRELPPATPTIHHVFCVQYRLRQLAPTPIAPSSTIIRAEVRVFWARSELQPIDNCDTPPVNPDGVTAINTYHFLHTAVTLRPNTL